jgi:hypothetical protein
MTIPKKHLAVKQDHGPNGHFFGWRSPPYGGGSRSGGFIPPAARMRAAEHKPVSGRLNAGQRLVPWAANRRPGEVNSPLRGLWHGRPAREAGMGRMPMPRRASAVGAPLVGALKRGRCGPRGAARPSWPGRDTGGTPVRQRAGSPRYVPTPRPPRGSPDTRPPRLSAVFSENMKAFFDQGRHKACPYVALRERDAPATAGGTPALHPSFWAAEHRPRP